MFLKISCLSLSALLFPVTVNIFKSDKYQEAECMRLVCWLRHSLSLFKELKQRGIEGVCWGEIDEIEKDIQNKEKKLRLLTDYR